MRVGVIGVGSLGQHHARILAGIEGAVLAAVVDRDPDRAGSVAARHGVTALTDLGDLPPDLDAVTVAVPTVDHAAVVARCLDRGLAVLVEKPMAATLAEARAMADQASRAGRLLLVGHTERFNPAVQAALPVLKTPRFIEVHRLSGFPERSLDIDVVFDVMIHDLDVLLTVERTEVVSVDAIGVPVLTPKVDIANVRLKFASGCIANVTASRISKDAVRKVRFFQPDMYVSVDYAAQELEVWRLTPQPGGRPRIEGGPVPVEQDEPLRRELADFVSAIQMKRPPLVTGADGRRALALATRVAEAMGQ